MLRRWSSSRASDRLGLLFFVNINQAFNTQSSVIRLFPAERALFRRERKCGAYRVLPYFLAGRPGGKSGPSAP